MARLYETTAGVFLLDSRDRVIAIFGQNPFAGVGSFGAGKAVPAPVNTAAPTATASTTFVNAGVGLVITPQVTGTLLVNVNFTQGNSTGNGCKTQIYTNAGSAVPANGTAVAGTAQGQPATFTALTGSLVQPGDQQAIVEGLTVGTSYWVDLMQAAVTGGSCALTLVHFLAYEIG